MCTVCVCAALPPSLLFRNCRRPTREPCLRRRVSLSRRPTPRAVSRSSSLRTAGVLSRSNPTALAPRSPQTPLFAVSRRSPHTASSHSQVVTCGADTFVKVFDADNIGAEPRTIEHHDAAINTIAINPKVRCRLVLSARCPIAAVPGSVLGGPHLHSCDRPLAPWCTRREITSPPARSLTS